MIGMSAGVAGLRSMLGSDVAAVSTSEWCVAGITLATMALLNVWGHGILRMVCALTGLAVGYVAAGFAGLLGQLTAVGEAPWIGLPSLGHLSWSFDATLIAPFAIASIAAAMKAAGTITVCQKTNDADWSRPDMQLVKSGVLAEGLGTAAAGLHGGVGINTSTPVVGLAQATGVASRQVAVAVGAMFLLLGFFPKLTALLAVMPRSVIVPALLFAVTFIIINGLQVISSRLLDARRTLVLGLSLIAGLAVEVFPSIAAMAPRPLVPLVGSSLVLSTLLALALNLLFRIGVKKTVRLTIEARPADSQRSRIFSIECGQMGRPAGCGQARDLRGAAIARSCGRKLLARRPDHTRGELRRVQPRYSRLISRRSAGVSRSPAVDRTDPRQRQRRRAARGLHATPQRRPRALGCQGRTGTGAFHFRSLRARHTSSAWQCSRRASRRS
jgi:NCS2 family nucleobase:cation symporter-2